MSIDQYQEAVAQMERRYNDLQNERDDIFSKLQTLKDSNHTLTEENEYFLRKVTGVQSEMNNMRNHQARLETQLYSQERSLEDLKKENQGVVKVRRDLEKKLASELQLFERERLAWQERENELSREIRSLKNSINGETTLDGAISPKRRVSISTNGRSSIGDDESSLKSPDGPSTSDPKLLMRVKAQERTITDLKVEVDIQKQLAAEHMSESQRQGLRITQLENELAQVQQMNRGLMEDNESYQILLHEKTMSGEFMMNPIMQQNRFASSSSSLPTAEEDVAATKKASKASGSPGGGLNLAAELGRVEYNDNEKLTEEIKKITDENKALTLYIQKILLRIMMSDPLILSIDPPSPDPPKPTLPPLVIPSPTPSTPSTDSQSKARRRRTTISNPISFWGRKNSAEDVINDDVKPKPSVSTSGHSRKPSETVESKETAIGSLGSLSDADDKAHRRHSSAVNTDGKNGVSNRNSSTPSFLKRLSSGWVGRTATIQNPTEETSVNTEDTTNEADKLTANGINGSGELRKSGEVQVLGSLGEVAEEDA